MLGVELDGKYRTRVVNNPLVGFVVLVGEENRPITRQALRVDSKAVVLCRDEASPSRCVSTRLIMTTVTIPESHRTGYTCRICS